MSEQRPGPRVVAVTRAPSRLGWLVASGAVSLALAVALYASGLSRAVGVVLLVLGAAALLAAAVVRARGAWPGRAWLVLVAVLLGLLATYGIAIWIYALATPNTSV